MSTSHAQVGMQAPKTSDSDRRPQIPRHAKRAEMIPEHELKTCRSDRGICRAVYGPASAVSDRERLVWGAKATMQDQLHQDLQFRKASLVQDKFPGLSTVETRTLDFSVPD
jgi:hypothetical protein